jgi:hypothetical protein
MRQKAWAGGWGKKIFALCRAVFSFLEKGEGRILEEKEITLCCPDLFLLFAIFFTVFVR